VNISLGVKQKAAKKLRVREKQEREERERESEVWVLRLGRNWGLK